VQVFERLMAGYPPAKFPAAAHAAWQLFAYYDGIDPARANTLAHAMAAASPRDSSWQATLAYSGAMAAAETQLEHDPAGALAALKSVKPPFGVSKARLELLQARATDGRSRPRRRR
jgi:hypothetical protein